MHSKDKYLICGQVNLAMTLYIAASGGFNMNTPEAVI